MSEKRFPPPGNEVGYREAALPITTPHEPDAPALPQHRPVIASRPDDPDVALRKASIDPIQIRRQDERVARRLAAQRRAGFVMLAVFIAYIALRLLLHLR